VHRTKSVQKECGWKPESEPLVLTNIVGAVT
jgi:hypothetical protein